MVWPTQQIPVPDTSRPPTPSTWSPATTCPGSCLLPTARRWAPGTPHSTDGFGYVPSRTMNLYVGIWDIGSIGINVDNPPGSFTGDSWMALTRSRSGRTSSGQYSRTCHGLGHRLGVRANPRECEERSGSGRLQVTTTCATSRDWSALRHAGFAVGPCHEGRWRRGGAWSITQGAVLRGKTSGRPGLTAGLGAALRKAGQSPLPGRGRV